MKKVLVIIMVIAEIAVLIIVILMLLGNNIFNYKDEKWINCQPSPLETNSRAGSCEGENIAQ